MFQEHLSKLSKRQWCMVLCVGFLITLGIIGLWLKSDLEVSYYFSVREGMRNTLQERTQPPPPDVNPNVWRDVVITTDMAFGIVFFNPDSASLSELRSFERDLLESPNHGPSANVKWIWKRLAAVKGSQIEKRLNNLRRVMGEGGAEHTMASDSLPTAVDEHR